MANLWPHILLVAAAGICAWSHPATARNVVVRQFASGSGQNAVGIVDASLDTEIAGPQALSAAPDGSLYLLDQINGRILSFDPKNRSTEPRAMRLPEDLEPTDLVVRQADILVWDGSIHTLQPTATPSSPGDTSYRGLEEISTRAGDDLFAVSAFAQMGSQNPGDAIELLDPNTRAVQTGQPRQRSRQYVASRGAGAVVADVIPESGEAAVSIEVRRNEDMAGAPLARLVLRVRDGLGAVELLEVDNSGRMFVFAENIPADSAGAAAFVARYSPTGTLEGVYDLPLSNVPLSRRFVAVTGSGDVYFLRTQRTGADVLGVGFRAIRSGRIIDVRPPESAVASFPAGGPITAVRPLTRQSVIETAFAFESIQWKVTPSAYGPDPDMVCRGFSGRIRRPWYIHNKVGQEVRGIPYCWGCMGSLEQIQARIDHGTKAGNICTHNDPIGGVAGVDCSAFVSATWGLATQYTTSAIPSIASRIQNAWDLRPGDALDKPGSHVMLFLRFTADRKAEVMESSPGGCNGKVCRNVYPLASLLARGYAPMRYKALLNDTAPVAFAPEPKNETNKEAKQEARHDEPSHRRRHRR
jgi:hypothetical protein